MRGYTFYHEGQEYHTDNLAAFCIKHKLQRRHMAEVVNGNRQSHRGWSLPPEMRKTKPATINVDDEDDPNGDGSMTLEQWAALAEGAVKAQEDPEYEAMIMDRIGKLRRGEPLEVHITD